MGTKLHRRLILLLIKFVIRVRLNFVLGDLLIDYEAFMIIYQD